MSNNFKMIAVIVIGIIILSLFRVKYSDYNLNRTISACMVGIKKTTKEFNPEKARKHCEKEIKKKIK
tara:strand:+ start:624 stop:824 length:201 start_codon:yes stop_codon:yes gene_type:complete